MTNKNDYTKRPVTIQAVEWTGKNLREVITFTDGPPDARTMHAQMKWEDYCDLVERDGLKIHTLEGVMSAAIGDYIIKGVKGEHYPCKPDVFHLTYSKPTVKPVHSDALTASAPIQGEQVREACRHEFSDDGGFTVHCSKCDLTINAEPPRHVLDSAAQQAFEAGGNEGGEATNAANARSVRPLGYMNKKDIARLQDEIAWDGSYLSIGVDHWAQWQEDTPYDHLQAIYTHPATPADSRVVPVDLLERAASYMAVARSESVPNDYSRASDELRALLNGDQS